MSKKTVDNSAKPVVDAEVVKLTLPDKAAPEPVRVIFEWDNREGRGGWTVYVTGKGSANPEEPSITEPHDAIHAFMAACRSVKRVVQNCSAHDVLTEPDGKYRIIVGVSNAIASLDDLIEEAVGNIPEKEQGNS